MGEDIEVLMYRFNLKRNIGIIAVLLCVSSIFAQNKFSHISLVSFRNNLTYVIGEFSQTYTAERTLKPFSINKYETTYGLWYQTRVMAEKNGYHFENAGQPGSEGRRGAPVTPENMYQPVTMISWYDAIVWCNALSELLGRNPCYKFNGSVIKDSSDSATCDLCECDWKVNGFRLPSESEWEYSARRTKNSFQEGNYVSGQIDENGNGDLDVPYSKFAWDTITADGTRVVGTTGTIFSPESITEPGTGNANGAGIFDMSGNVLEFCWDWIADYVEGEEFLYGPAMGYERVSRGGSWSLYTPFLFAGDRYSYDPNEKYNYFGFRIACSLIE